MEKETTTIDNSKIDYNDNESILKQIFETSKVDNRKFAPILKKTSGEIIEKFFSDYPNITDCKMLKNYIIKKMKLINQIKEIIGNSYEILYVIFDFLSNKNNSPFIYFIDLYINFITMDVSSEDKNEIIDELKNIFSWFISCGLLTKMTVDYLYQKLALFQLEKKLTINIFSDFLPLIEIIYGKYYDSSISQNFISKKYIYFNDKETSLIKTNITKDNPILFNNGFSLILWFYLNDYEISYNSSLAEIKTDNSGQINIILNENNDIIIKYNNSIILEEEEKIVYKLKPNIWTQLKIVFDLPKLSLFLYQNDTNNETMLFDKKNYIIPSSNEEKEENENINWDNFLKNSIFEISFFKNFTGKIGSILFFNTLNNLENNMVPINSLCGIENKKINEFIKENKLYGGLYFVLAPSLYLYDQNEFIYSTDRMIGKLPDREEQYSKNQLNLNSILIFHNYTNNIYFLGGCNNFLPLFEIFYKLSLEDFDINILKNLFNTLFSILETIFSNRIKNALLPLKSELSFFESLQLFMQKIDSKFYDDNENLLNKLISIANYYDELKIKKVIELKEKSGYFTNILFNPVIIMKFNLNLQIKLIKQIGNYQVPIPFEDINILLLLLSQKYMNDEIEKNNYSNILFDYIGKIFENANVDDSQRENLFLLHKNKNNLYSNNISLSDNIFIQIMKIFIIYLDLGVNKNKYTEAQIKRRKNTVNYFLNSSNNFIECLLNYLSETNIHFKKVIINFLRELTQSYGELLDQYFAKLAKNKKSKRIKKEEFYDFIKENIAPNYSNEYIKEDDIKSYKNINSVKDVSIFSLDNKEDNQIIDNNLNNKESIENLQKIYRNKRSKSLDKVQKIKKVIEEKNSGKKLRKDSFSKNFNNQLLLKEYLKKEISKTTEKDLIKIPKIKKLTNEEKIIIQNTKFEISFILNNWLVSLISEGESKNNKILEESIQNVIDYIVKFISYSKELEVIYRTLLLISDQKDRSKKGQKSNNNNIYSKLLKYLSKNELFIQILIELLINSYIFKNIKDNKVDELFEIISKSKEDSSKNKEKYLKLIYDHSKELLLDIYFDEENEKRYEIIIIMYKIILKISRGLEDNIDETKSNILFKFIKEFFLDICEIYKKGCQVEDCVAILSFLIEYSFLLKTADDYVTTKYEKIKNKCSNCFPDFLIFGIIYETNISEWSGYDIYNFIYNNLKTLFYIEKVFNHLEMIYKTSHNNNSNYNKEKNIFIYDFDLVKSIVNEVIYNRNKKDGNIKIKALFSSYKYEGYDSNFPLINIISLFNSLCIYLFYSDINENKKINIISLLNDIQNYIIFLILASCILKENDSFPQQKTYEQAQGIIYKNLFFNIKNIINHLDDKENHSNYLEILHNIFLFLFIIYDIGQKESDKKKSNNFFKGMFSKSIDISKTGCIQLVQFYMEHLKKIFNNDNMELFKSNKKENKEKALQIINDFANEKIINNPSLDLYNISFFRNIAIKRDNDLKMKLRLLITQENEFNTAINDYKKLFLKVKGFKNISNFSTLDETKNNREEIFKIKRYRKIKKHLYSFNNSYSNLSTFYNFNVDKNKNKYLLKYKLSNFLSKDMTRKILQPIIDINYYLPNFRKYHYESNQLYYHSNEKVYTVDLEIFSQPEKPPISPSIINQEKSQYFIEENVCYIKTTNHIKGKIFHLDNAQCPCFYFCMAELPSSNEILEKNYADYDSLNNSCFSSLFRTNLNKRDFYLYLKINFSDIIFIFKRKYNFRNDSIEIFTPNHKSYYFKFKNSEKRDKFIDHLLTILNKDSSVFKKLYKPINGIDANNKKIILGYYKDIDNNNEYSNIINIQNLWKNNKISTLEYLMWINIYGNRSFRDITQFPVFPWIIDNYETNTFDDIINNDSFRNFGLPMGMLALNKKGKERQRNYLSNYINMSIDLKKEEIIDFKTNEEEDIDDEDTENDNEDPNKNYPKIPKYNYDINKLYINPDIECEIIPHCFGSHYSNSMYVSHFLGRLFPYSITMIEIQGNGFDCSERLFLCLDKSFISSTTEKGDLRELTPEFYYLPELFLNINQFNFGKVDVKNFVENVNYLKEIIEKNNGNNMIEVQDVLLPNWCKYNPYLLILKKRELLENKNKIDLNPWIDLIFGITQRGVKAQLIGNLFFPSSYDGVIDIRIKDSDILEDRNNTEHKLRYHELGVNPTKVFSKANIEKDKLNNNISIINQVEKPLEYLSGFEGKIIFLSNIGNNYTNLFIYFKNHKLKKISFDEKLNVNGKYSIKEDINYKDLIYLFNEEILCKLIIRYLYKSNMILITGFYSSCLFLINLETNIKSNNDNLNVINIISKVNKEDQASLKNLGKGTITSLEISKDEKYIIYGNDKGTLVVLENDYKIFLESNDNKKYLKVLKIIPSHSRYIINTISINSDLNLFADCSYDNFINIYNLPSCEIINSIYINNNFKVDYIWLSAQPLASIILYSNKLCQFKCYNINGHDLNVEQNDRSLNEALKTKNEREPISSPVIFTDGFFIDYLLYVFGNKYILLRKIPLMEIVLKIDFEGNDFISFVNVSLNKEYIYAVDNDNKKVYLIKYKKPNYLELINK